MARQPSKILVIQTAFLGDLVLTTSFLANLRALAPEAEIHFLTTPAGAKLLTPNEFRVLPLPYDKRGKQKGFTGFLRMAKRLRALKPNIVFCLHRSLRSSTLARAAGGEVYGFQEGAGSSLFEHRVAREKGAYEAEKNHRLLEAWAGERARGMSLFPRLSAAPEEIAEAEALLAGVRDFVAIAPSSVWATKRWPAEKFAELGARLGLPVVLVGGNDAADLEAARGVLGAWPAAAPKPLDLTGKTGLGTLKAVLARARLVVANDSAPLHVAIAMGAPVLGIFGPTVKEIGFFPLAPAGKSAVAELAGLECRPCGLHGHDKCPLGHFRCMRDLSVELALERAKRLL